MARSLLEYLNARASMSDIDKTKVKQIMNDPHKTDKEVEDLWKRINELGGYEALEDGDGYEFKF